LKVVLAQQPPTTGVKLKFCVATIRTTEKLKLICIASVSHIHGSPACKQTIRLLELAWANKPRLMAQVVKAASAVAKTPRKRAPKAPKVVHTGPVLHVGPVWSTLKNVDKSVLSQLKVRFVEFSKLTDSFPNATRIDFISNITEKFHCCR
jgi:hypothetical protein